MQNKLSITTKIDQRLFMNQQLTQAINLLQTNTVELQQIVLHYLESNILLEVEGQEESDHMPNIENHNLSSNEYLIPEGSYTKRKSSRNEEVDIIDSYGSPVTLYQHLLQQVNMQSFNSHTLSLAEEMIYLVNEDGYLKMGEFDILELINKFSTTHEEIERVAQILKTFEPVGICASNLQETLLIQLKECYAQHACYNLCLMIITEHFELLTKQKYQLLLKKMHISNQELQEALKLVRTLEPKPGKKFFTESNYNIEPEIMVKKVNGNWKAFLTDSVLNRIQINKQYKSMINRGRKDVAYQSLHKQLQEAEWLIKSLEHRNQTLLAVANYIVHEQRDFFERGPLSMKPLNIKLVADHLNLHESTVSRVTNGKYLLSFYGLHELKYFFRSHVKKEDGNICSDTHVKEHIKNIIKNEPAQHAYSDAEITEQLKQLGIHISRRTIVKYRQSLKILPSYKRKNPAV